jgi:hypothetical protein
MKRRPRARVERRERERSLGKLARDRERLALLERGGAADRPIEVDSSSVISGRARSRPCPLCGGTLRLDEETAERVGGVSLRAAHLECARCGVKRRLWFRIGSPLPS